MPKEVIQGTFNEELGVSVGWAKDTSVQLATLNLVHEKVDQYDPAAGWWVDLSREQVNRLIRVLRRARDQAYGADE